MTRLLLLALTLAAAAGACKTVREELPTRPEYPDGLDGSALIPTAPTPTPPPTPDDPGPLPANPGGVGGGGGTNDGSGACGAPTPPPVVRFNVGILHRQPDRAVLNATPLVGPDPDYCQMIGFTDGRHFCPVRPEGHPERLACEALRVGRAADTGRIGPTWSAEGSPCQGRSGGASCQNHPDNQFLVFAYGEGTFRACADGACGEKTLP